MYLYQVAAASVLALAMTTSAMPFGDRASQPSQQFEDMTPEQQQVFVDAQFEQCVKDDVRGATSRHDRTAC